MLIILDRDGVINEERSDYVRSVEQWRPIAGSIEAIAQLCRGGHRIAVASNQSGLARGLFSLDELTAMHNKLCYLVESAGGAIDGVFFCPHLPSAQCQCRKPAPGLMHTIARELGVEINTSILIGDCISDLQLARATRAQGVLVRTGHGLQTEARLKSSQPGDPVLKAFPVYDNLSSAARAILAGARWSSL